MNSNKKSAEVIAAKFFKQKKLKEYRIYQQKPELLKQEEMIYAQLVGLEDSQLKQLTQQMWGMIFNPSNQGKMLSNMPKVKKIAHKLNKLGGLDLMLEAYKLMPKLYRGEIDLAWDGIGEWKKNHVKD